VAPAAGRRIKICAGLGEENAALIAETSGKAAGEPARGVWLACFSGACSANLT